MPLDQIPDIEDTKSRDASDEDLLAVANALLAHLPSADRLVLTLLYFEKCSVREIAERMGWNQALVKTRAYRARKKLLGIANSLQIWDKLEWTN